jgi:TRAP-type C4-dicarboxylate transport system permease small subunit
MRLLAKQYSSFKNSLFVFIRGFNAIGMFALMGMVLLIVVDISLRRFFNSPIPWSMEAVRVMLVVVVFPAIAYCAMHKAHISVDILTSHFSPKFRSILSIITYLMCAGLCAFMAWAAIIYGLDSWESGYITGLLPLPIAPFIFVVALGSILFCLVLLIQLVDSVTLSRSV